MKNYEEPLNKLNTECYRLIIGQSLGFWNILRPKPEPIYHKIGSKSISDACICGRGLAVPRPDQSKPR